MRNELQEELAAAFDEDLADAVDAFTCEKLIYSGEFDFETQTYPVVGDESYSGRGVLFGSYLKDMVKPTDYQVTDSKAIVLQNEVTGIPQIDDVWVTSRGGFKVVNIGADPTGSIWTCQLRKI
ncbi:glutamate 5-kinase [Acinetobacter sp. ANC 3781]|uniref:glutamate 5-kinase n=1 Tax=Acinetobacter sp. ANC 3781 TaxID=2529835 RepID=UPI001038C29A|nr:glutamate 5-kinase [Acinetobacter sp. ANC 3781]TCB79436.1 glutamate 5-kinase [Acinetobacter sp. ANC 3781]